MFLQVIDKTSSGVCTVAWSHHYVNDKVVIEKVQRRFTRMIPHLKNIPYEERLAILQELIGR